MAPTTTTPRAPRALRPRPARPRQPPPRAAPSASGNSPSSSVSAEPAALAAALARAAAVLDDGAALAARQAAAAADLAAALAAASAAGGLDEATLNAVKTVADQLTGAAQQPSVILPGTRLPPPPPDDLRALGEFDARFHSTSTGATPADLRVLPRRIVLVRHAESLGNVDKDVYAVVPDPQLPLTPRGEGQAAAAGEAIRSLFDTDGTPYRLHFYTSPYLRSAQTARAIAAAFPPGVVVRVQEDVQLREQDFGNFQDVADKEREKAERLRFGRFWFRFAGGESAADVYDRLTLFEDHLIRDINAGRFARGTSLVLVTHGLAMRVLLMRWLKWSIAEFLQVYNPPNALPIVLERTIDPVSPDGAYDSIDGLYGGGEDSVRVHTKALYRLTPASAAALKGCTPEMCQIRRGGSV